MWGVVHGKVRGLGEEVTEGTLENLGLVLSLEGQGQFGQEKVKRTCLVYLQQKGKEVPREAETQHGCRNVFFQSSLSFTTMSLCAPCLGDFYDPIHLFAVSLRFALKFKS